MEEELTSSLRERQIAEFIEDDEVASCKVKAAQMSGFGYLYI